MPFNATCICRPLLLCFVFHVTHVYIIASASHKHVHDFCLSLDIITSILYVCNRCTGDSDDTMNG